MTDEYAAFLEEQKKKETDHLEHHGIKGQKWGIRRFQNEDGTRINSEPRKKKEPEYNSKTLQYKKKAQNLSDEELDRRNKRMQREVQYNQLRSQLQPKSKKERRKELMRTIFIATATAAAADVVKSTYSYFAKKFITSCSPFLIS